jgi:hypothetical protein
MCKTPSTGLLAARLERSRLSQAVPLAKAVRPPMKVAISLTPGRVRSSTGRFRRSALTITVNGAALGVDAAASVFAAAADRVAVGLVVGTGVEAVALAVGVSSALVAVATFRLAMT